MAVITYIRPAKQEPPWSVYPDARSADGQTGHGGAKRYGKEAASMHFGFSYVGLIFLLMGVTYAGLYFCGLRAGDALLVKLAVNTMLIGTYGVISWVLLRSRPVPSA